MNKKIIFLSVVIFVSLVVFIFLLNLFLEKRAEEEVLRKRSRTRSQEIDRAQKKEVLQKRARQQPMAQSQAGYQMPQQEQPETAIKTVVNTEEPKTESSRDNPEYEAHLEGVLLN